MHNNGKKKYEKGKNLTYLPCEQSLAESETNLKYHQDAANDAGISVDHSLLHDVADAAEVAGLNGVLFAQ